MADDETFENVQSGASLTYPIQAGALQKGSHVVINGHPCKVVSVTTSKTGKHGHAKANITALDIFTEKKYEEVAPTSHSLPAPFVVTQSFQLLDVNEDGHVTLMMEDGETREDLKMPEKEELAKSILDALEAGKTVMVSVTKAMGIEQILSFKTESQN